MAPRTGRKPGADVDKSKMTLTQTLESPPRSGNTTVMTIVVHDRDGSEKSRIAITKKAAIVGVALAFFSFIILTDGPAQLEQMQRRKEAAELRPTMEKLADDGNEAASLWLVKNYFSENKKRMAKLVEGGNVEAMYVQGRLQVANGKKDEGKRLIAAAAAKGYAPAVQDINGPS